MEDELITIIGIGIGVIGIISAWLLRIYLANRKENKEKYIDRGSLNTEIEHFKDKIKTLEKDLEIVENDISDSHMNYDSLQSQIAAVSERVATLEERTRK